MKSPPQKKRGASANSQPPKLKTNGKRSVTRQARGSSLRVSRRRKSGSMNGDPWVFTCYSHPGHPNWDNRFTYIGTRKEISKVVNLAGGVPYGWRLLKGERAHRFLLRALTLELRLKREQEALRYI